MTGRSRASLGSQMQPCRRATSTATCRFEAPSLAAAAERWLRTVPAFFPDRDVCGADLAPDVTVLKVPQGVTSAKPLTAHFGTRQAILPGVPRGRAATRAAH
jgi:hypothetical protein